MQIQRPWTSKTVPALGQLKVAVGRREKDQLHASLSPQKRGHIGTPSLASAKRNDRHDTKHKFHLVWSCLRLSERLGHLEKVLGESAEAALVDIGLKIGTFVMQRPLPQELEKFKALRTAVSVERFGMVTPTCVQHWEDLSILLTLL